MNQFEDPYATRDASTPVMPQMPQAAQPPQVKVLGILHLVFAGLGVISLVVALAAQLFIEKMQEKISSTNPGMDLSNAAFSTEAMKELTWLGHAATMILGVLLAIAGIRLLKRQLSGLTYSNLYAWTSICLKLLTIVVFVTVSMPKLEKMMQTMGATSGRPPAVASSMRMTITITTIGGQVVSCIYPILVLILLNRESVRKSLV